ncbi:MAG: molybdopterin cofactor-binding domain-containing protein [Hyphomicrobiaceae bacterium]
MTEQLTLSRRGFIVGGSSAGAGLAIGLALPIGASHIHALARSATSPEINAWVVVNPDDTIVVRVARSEMGQGTLTGLCQLVAEELACDWSKVTAEYPTPGENLRRKRAWGNMSTGGSRGIRESESYVRKGGAAARMMLVSAAAAQWNVPTTECRASNSVITHPASGRTITYGKVAAAAARMTPPSDADIKLKDPKDWTIAGKPLKRLDTKEKLDGRLVYAIDVTLPGMLNAAIRDCPHFGGKLHSFDEAKVKAMPGVRHVLRIGETGLAVVADTWWRAKTALDAADIVWDKGPNSAVTSATIAAQLKDGLDSTEGVFTQTRIGDVGNAQASAAKTVEAVYATPFLNHATMEPMNCTAVWTPEKCEVWVATQNGEASLAACAAAAGLKPSQCEVYKHHLGGGFGRRGFQDYVTKAVLAAKQIPGTPIKMIWSREEDMVHGRFRPITQAKLKGTLDANGDLTSLALRISGQSILAGVRPAALRNGMDFLQFQSLDPKPDSSIGQFGYTVANLVIDHAMRNTPLPPGFWRGVNSNQNVFYLESFIDELAHAAGKDPLAFRRKLMANHPKHLAVLNAVAEKAGYDKPAEKGLFRGIAQGAGFGSFCAAAAEVSVRANGKIKVERLVMGTDCGTAVNPDQIAAQVEGSVVYGLGAAFYQENTVNEGRVVEENFDTFGTLLIDQMPRIETVLVPSGGFWGGVGEPTIMVAAPAVINAIFAATGKRVRSLPLKNHGLV